VPSGGQRDRDVQPDAHPIASWALVMAQVDSIARSVNTQFGAALIRRVAVADTGRTPESGFAMSHSFRIAAVLLGCPRESLDNFLTPHTMRESAVERGIRMADGPIIIVSRAVAKYGFRNGLIPLIRSITEHDATDEGILVHTFQSERDVPNVIWEYSVYRDTEARESHGKSTAPTLAKMDGMWEQWPYSNLCTPIIAKGIQF
jgi:quinol monooxygenase YgiN